MPERDSAWRARLAARNSAARTVRIGVVRRLLTAFSALLFAAGAGCQSGVFTCETDIQCGSGGRCEFDGYCSFPDTECESGRRYGRHATNELVDACVSEMVSTDAAGGETDSASGSSSSDGSSTSSVPLTSSTGDAMSTSEAPPESTSTGTTTTDESEGESLTTEPPAPSLTLWLQCDAFTDAPPDTSADPHSAECSACPTESTSFSGGSCRFDADSAPVHYFQNGSEFETEGFTVMAWVQRVDLDADTCGTIVAKESSERGRYSWRFGLCRSATMPTIGVFGSVCPSDESMNCHQGLRTIYDLADEARWHHIAFTHDSENATLYHDGVGIFPFTGREVGYDGSPMFFGGDDGDGPTGSGGPFFGDADEVRVFDRVLTEREIFEIYSARAP